MELCRLAGDHEGDLTGVVQAAVDLLRPGTTDTGTLLQSLQRALRERQRERQRKTNKQKHEGKRRKMKDRKKMDGVDESERREIDLSCDRPI